MVSQGVVVGPTELQRMRISPIGQSISTSRRAVLSSSRQATVADADSSRPRATDLSPIALRNTGGQRSSPVGSADPKRSGSARLIPNSRNYEATLKGIECLSFDMDKRHKLCNSCSHLVWCQALNLKIGSVPVKAWNNVLRLPNRGNGTNGTALIMSFRVNFE
eukprot:Gb_22094 [translate_table: standard]